MPPALPTLVLMFDVAVESVKASSAIRYSDGGGDGDGDGDGGGDGGGQQRYSWREGVCI